MIKLFLKNFVNYLTMLVFILGVVSAAAAAVAVLGWIVTTFHVWGVIGILLACCIFIAAMETHDQLRRERRR